MNVHAEVLIEFDEVVHLPLCKYWLSPLQAKILSRLAPTLHIMKTESFLKSSIANVQ